MGNNTSTTRKSLASLRHAAPFRKSHQSQSNHHNLEEEFSDLILHEVKRQKHDSGVADVYLGLLARDGAGGLEKRHFSNDLLEDEFNELGHGILENGAGEEVARSILPSDAVETVASATLDGSGDTIGSPDVLKQLRHFESVDADADAGYSRLQTPGSYVTSDAGAENGQDAMLIDSVGSPSAAGGAVETVDGNTAGSTASSAVGSRTGSASKMSSAMLANVDFTRAALPAMARQRPQAPTSRLSGPATVDGSAPQNPVYAGGSGSVSNSNSNGNGNGSRTSINQLVPVRIKWVNQTMENINKVSIIGSFSNWRDVIKLKRSTHHPNEYLTTVKLPLGVHKLLYVVNNEYRVLELLPTATDQEGIFFNWFEVLDPHHLFNNNPNLYRHSNLSLGGTDGGIVQVAGEHDASQIQKKSMSFLAKVSKQEKESVSEHVEYAEHAEPPVDGVSATQINYSPYHEQSSTSLLEEAYSTESHLEYSSEIPEMLVDYNYFKNKGADYELPEPPQLPAHLNNVLLNKISSSLQSNANSVPLVASGNRPALRRADSSYYASNGESYHRVIPNHVILNHLMTTSIRNDVLTVACITRYSGKFVTQVMHSPADVLPE